MSKLSKNTLNFNHPVKFSAAHNKGFTLLEIMVSVAIISIVLVSILRLQGQTITMNDTIRFYTIAPLLADTKISEITLNPANFELSSSGDFGDEYPGYSWKMDVEEIL